MTLRHRASLFLFCCLFAGSVLAQGVTLPDHVRVALDNGTVLILSEKHDVPLVGVRALIRGGAAADPAGLGGVSSLLAGMLEKGAGARGSAAFAEAVASVGGRLATSADLEAISVSGQFLARDKELMIELLADLLQRPTLDKAEMANLQNRYINFIGSAKDSSLHQLAPIYASAFLFGEHPYGNPVDGSEASLSAIRHSDLLAYYNDHVGADRLVISVVGDFVLDDMLQLLQTAFGEWRPAAAELAPLARPEKSRGRRVLLVDKPGAAQTYFWIGNIGVADGFPGRAELDIANTVFGGRFTSMLNTSLRVESGLTYGAGSVLRRHSVGGSLGISSYTETSTTIDAVDLSLSVLDRLRNPGISAELLQSAKNYVLGQFPTKLETAAQLAGTFANIEAFDLGTAYIDSYGGAIAAAGADAVAGTIDDVYPRSADLVFIFLGDANEIRDDISKYGPVTEVSISAPHFRWQSSAAQ